MKLLFLILCLSINVAHANEKFSRATALIHLMDNISPEGASRGAVIASPSRSNPDYYFHWVRDGGIAMHAIANEYALSSRNSRNKNRYFEMLEEYAVFSRLNQITVGSNLGEPKFYVDGRVFDGPWGRPQNDGPALRAITMIHWAQTLIQEGQEDYVRKNLYNFQAPSVIPIDLQFIAQHWSDPCFDLWEEMMGNHFYTRMVQRKALREGAKLALALGDQPSAAFYSQEADKISREMEFFWSKKLGYILSTLDSQADSQFKPNNLDTAVILGVLHGDTGENFSLADDRVLATLLRLESEFKNLYYINDLYKLGTAIGRYPEDRYSGSDFNGGNPWVLTTLAFAEIYYKLASDYALSGKPMIMSRRFREKADGFMKRVLFHANPDQSLSEQIYRESGYMTSAVDLTWNYAALLSAMDAQEKSGIHLNKKK